jgi:hypothetical protein
MGKLGYIRITGVKCSEKGNFEVVNEQLILKSPFKVLYILNLDLFCNLLPDVYLICT